MFIKFCEYLSNLSSSIIDESINTKELKVDYNDLFNFDESLAEDLLNNPDKYLLHVNEAIKNFRNSFEYKEEDYPINLIVSNLPEYVHIPLRKVGREELNHFVTLRGIVTLLTPRKTELYYGAFFCSGDCNKQFFMKTEHRRLKKNIVCPKCHKKKVKYLLDDNTWNDVQSGVLQEDFSDYIDEFEPRTVVFHVRESLVDKIKQGKKYELYGVLRIREPLASTSVVESVMEKYFDVYGFKEIGADLTNLEVTEEEEEMFIKWSKRKDLASEIIDVISPSIKGYPMQKYSIALQMFGGTPFYHPVTHQKVRGDIHSLLIGDAGTGKSVLIFDAKQLTPKGVFVTGKGVTSAGLGAATVRESFGIGKDNWVVKAGALVLASGGFLFLDEMDKLDDNDKSMLHTAMEQQIVKIDKAGIHAEFKAETSILAAANPIGARFDPDNPDLSMQFNIPLTLLSRFDLIWVFKDSSNKNRDRNIATFVTNKFSKDEVKYDGLFTPELFQKYVSFAKNNFEPVLNDDAREKIIEHYTSIRDLSRKKKVFSITVRFCEATIRLSQAIAKMHYSNEVILEYANIAIQLMLNSLRGIVIDDDYLINNGFVDSLDGIIIPEEDKPNAIPMVRENDKLKVINRVFVKLKNHEGLVDREELIEALIDLHGDLFPTIETVEKELLKPAFENNVMRVRSRYYKSLRGVD